MRRASLPVITKVSFRGMRMDFSWRKSETVITFASFRGEFIRGIFCVSQELQIFK